jgi:hypothetical protein
VGRSAHIERAGGRGCGRHDAATLVAEVVAVVEQRSEPRVDQEERLRQQAMTRLRKKSDFHAHLLAYVLVNTFLVAIWWFTGHGFFWPIFPILGWGIGVAFNAWDVYRRQDYTEDQIRREMDRLR